MKLAYIAGKLRGQNISQNIALARKTAIKYWNLGYAVFCPHLNSGGLIGEAPEETFIAGNLEFLAKCDVIVMMKGWEGSNGAADELERAVELGIERVFE